jgi:hypothetical protein
MKFVLATIAAIAGVTTAQLPYVPLPIAPLPYVTPAAMTIPYSPTTISTISAIPAPPQPPRFQTQPGIQVARYPPLPAEYDFPFEQTKINTATGLLIRSQGAPLPPIPNLIKWKDGQWYQSPTNMWQYIQSPIHQFNDPASPTSTFTPEKWAYINNDNAVNLDNGLVFNNPYTAAPELAVAFQNGNAYALPQDPFNYMNSPFQPYNNGQGTAPTQIPQDAYAGQIGFTQGYNPETINVLKRVQGLNLNTSYDLNVSAPVPENPPQNIFGGW